MDEVTAREQELQLVSAIRLLAEQIFSRTAGAPLQKGNSVRVLKDGKENYPAWIDAISSARAYIHFESYIIYEDDVGKRFADLLAAKAREGVRVRVLYDWFGALGKTSHRFWKRLREAGVDVRCFNPPRMDSPLSWLTRDHRKMISVDGRIAFVTGLCVGRKWVGYPDRALEPWRDTGVVVRGPAVADIDLAFAQVWETVGGMLPEDELPEPETIPVAGDIALRVVASLPSTAGLYRLDQLIAALARNSLWLTDAYFAGATSYIQALRSAALDGVDVRLLVPGSTDIPIFRAISRAGYYSLLEAGVRVFEWNGPMMHAKTAVADGRWARVGSTNLNVASWMGNYELDVAVEDEGFAQAMEGMYLDDLTNSTEIVFGEHGVRAVVSRPIWSVKQRKRRAGSVTRASAGAIRIGSAVGAAMTNHRVLGPTEAKIMGVVGTFLLGLSAVLALWPKWIGVPVAALGAWLAVSLLVRAYRLYVSRGRAIDVALQDSDREDTAPVRSNEGQGGA
jgi:cardiolipin synthase